MKTFVKKIRTALKNNKGVEATNLWAQLEDIVEDKTYGIDWYNILKDDSTEFTFKKWFKSRNRRVNNNAETRSKFRHVHFFNENDSLDQLMNGEIRKKLGIPSEVTWGNQSGMVFDSLKGDFMSPVIDDVNYLLNQTNVKVTVYTGQLDLIVNSLGTETWIKRLTWPGISAFQSKAKEPFASVRGNPKAFVKKEGNLSFYWILQAGHMIPSDQLDVSVEMLKDVIGK